MQRARAKSGESESKNKSEIKARAKAKTGDSSADYETSGLIVGYGHLLELFTTEDAEVRRGKSGEIDLSLPVRWLACENLPRTLGVESVASRPLSQSTRKKDGAPFVFLHPERSRSRSTARAADKSVRPTFPARRGTGRRLRTCLRGWFRLR